MEQTSLQEQERENRPSRFEPRNYENVDDPQADRMDHRNEIMEEALGIPFINSRRSEDSETSLMETLGVDQV